MLWDPEDIEMLTFTNVMRIFSRGESSGDDAVTIKTHLEYRLAIKHVGIRISMKQTALKIQAAKEVDNVSNIASMNQAKLPCLSACNVLPTIISSPTFSDCSTFRFKRHIRSSEIVEVKVVKVEVIEVDVDVVEFKVIEFKVVKVKIVNVEIVEVKVVELEIVEAEVIEPEVVEPEVVELDFGE
ncbi:unnamed protein product [Hyaloperonospora brassicae]|uniref:Uncharacterized protein n=1 Tax=Hyaloperonospora brassicae TaxID=162125 RepID=A0AAV0TXG6_HYABA|nr:unnamed protein product [Hyaloperonospora brassicae]